MIRKGTKGPWLCLMPKLLLCCLVWLFSFASAFSHFSDKIYSVELREDLRGWRFSTVKRQAEDRQEAGSNPRKAQRVLLSYSRLPVALQVSYSEIYKEAGHVTPTWSPLEVCLLIVLEIALVVIIMLPLLSRYSHVWLFVTLWTVAHQPPLSMKFSGQEYWSGFPFHSPVAIWV